MSDDLTIDRRGLLGGAGLAALAGGLPAAAARGESRRTAVDRVDPFIGTGGHGHTYPGAARPFGMVQLSPDTDNARWDACSGYHHDDTTMLGFSHTHLRDSGCQKRRHEQTRRRRTARY